ncbi:MAG TPA: lysine--tRNA ligase [Fimbriimonadaceae bacterium]|nr:lysine--tRNA ligase [Fimbriimonadaceae bacterium]
MNQEEVGLREVRLQKLARMRELGHDPYQVETFKRSHSAQDLLDKFEENLDVEFAGRVVSYRLMGKAGFAHLSDGDQKIQVYCRKDDVGDLGWELYNLLDLGDHVGVRGYLFVTKTGEKSIHVRELVPLSKSLQTLPLGKEKDGQHWYGLTDVEQRYRHRHLDLICNPDARKALIDRAKIVSAVREYFNGAGYLEVETPLLQVVAGGAAARPFTTHYNAYDIDVKLRISLELYLKRLICGDIPAVYEIGRVFRNEGVSNRHNPEFTLLEFYEAYTNLEGMMKRVEECFCYVAKKVYGNTVCQIGEIGEIDFAKPWKRVDLIGSICHFSGLDPSDLSDLSDLKTAITQKGVVDKAHKLGGHIDLSKEDNLGGLIEKLLEVFVEPNLQEPTFVVGYPIETSPLAKKDPTNPRMTRRFEGYMFGREVCNAFSEINDPIDQKERFEQQAAELEKGDDEAHPYDEEFLYALESGMPPTGGCGIGMDRMAMIFTGAETIREVLFFPMMKPEHA